MAGNPVHYAEATLGVHRVFDEMGPLTTKLSDAHQRLNAAHARKREVVERLLVAEADLVAGERAANPEMSQAAFDRHIKTAIALSTECQALRAEQIGVQNEIDVAESEVKEIEFHLRIGTARLEELGGLLRFYAAAKQQHHTTTTPQGDST